MDKNRHQNQKKKIKWVRKACLPWAAYGFLFLWLLSGCQVSEEETENLVIVDQEEQIQQYSLARAERGDVVLTQQVRCAYQQVKQEDVSFSVSGKTVSEVYVSQGDQVKKGQLLAELGDSGQGERMEELEYQLERNRLLLDQTQPMEDYEISTLWLRFEYYSGQSAEEKNALKKNVEQIQKRYRYLREEYEDAIYLDDLELQSLRQETADNKLYAGMSGTVSWMKTGLKGSVSVREESVMRLTDNSECLFAVGDMKYRDLFTEGTAVDMQITFGGSKGDYQLMPYQMDEWEDKMLFSLVDGTEAEIEVGTAGMINIVLDKREGVLKIPSKSVHTADGKTFVYCLGEDNMREVKWIQTGLYGDDSVEVISGLAEGDMIIQ